MSKRKRVTCPHCGREVGTYLNGKMYGHYQWGARDLEIQRSITASPRPYFPGCRGSYRLP